MQACCVVTAAGRCPGLQRLRASSCRASRSSKAAPVNAQSRPGAAASSTGSGSGTASFGACVPASSSSLGRPSLHAAWLCTATGGGDGGSTGAGGGGVGGSGSGSGGSGGKGEGEEDGEEEFLDLQQAEEMAASKGIELPEDFRAAAGPEGGGLRRSALEGYFKLAGGGWLTSLLVRSLPAFRNRLLADRLFFFKVAAEVMIDSGCATVAELRKRGDDFWGEFEFYLSDLMVGLVLDVVLVTLLAPPALIGRSRAASATGLKKLLGRLPSAVFQKSLPGRRFTILERGGTFVKLGLEYSLAGIVCGFIGQGIANSLMRLKRHYGTTSEHDVAVPPLMRTALVWGLFMGVSSNSRYQVVFGLERIVDQTIARRIPQVAYFTTLAIRFANNVVGGENFIDMARWAGVQ